MEIEQNVWGFTPEGEAVIIYTMTNSLGASVRLTNIGAAVVALSVPDRTGKIEDVVLGYENFSDYVAEGPCMGKIAGRCANRIGQGRFTLDGVAYRLPQNKGVNHLHGGPAGFQDKLWNGRVETDRVVFALLSPDGDQKYPGELSVEVCYDWNDACELEISLYAKTDAPTIVNLTNHAYFNLRGADSGSVLDQELQLNASHYLITDRESIPSGELAPVVGTPMDFRTAKPLERDIEADFEPLHIGAGYDQCWTIDAYQVDRLSEVGTLYDPVSGRRMEILSTQPGVQIYTGNWLQGCPPSKSGREIENRDGVAIECQAYPDSINHPNFPSVVLRPDELYFHRIIYRFSTDS